MTDRDWVLLSDDVRSLDVVEAGEFARVWAAAGLMPGAALPREAVHRLVVAAGKLGAVEIGDALKRSRGSVSARFPDGQVFTGETT